MKRIEPTVVNNPFPPDFMAKFIDEFERVMKARDVMTRAQCADFLGLSTSTVDKLSRNGVLPFYTIGGLSGRLYLRSELIETIKISGHKK